MTNMTNDRRLELGFGDFENLRALKRGCSHLPASPGVYVVVADPSAVHGFLGRSVGGRFKGQDGTVTIDSLVRKWCDDADILYIGRAKNIRRRLDQFARYARGEPVGHRGGRYLWQLSEHDQLRVGWRLEADPVQAERELLDEFEAEFGRLPFANLVRGSRALALA
jgi:hypothetical protein